MDRATVMRVVSGYFTANDPVSRMDELDFLDLAMQLEEEHGAALPQFFEQMTPPPPYATEDALVDAFMTTHAALSHAQNSHKGEKP